MDRSSTQRWDVTEDRGRPPRCGRPPDSSRLDQLDAGEIVAARCQEKKV